MIVTYKEYMEDKQKFFKKHGYNFSEDTSPMDQFGMYYKTYTFEDGAHWYERMNPEWVKETFTIKLAPVEVEVKMFRTEYWNTDNSISRFYYERF